MIRKEISYIVGPFKDGTYMFCINQYDALPGECYPWETEKRIIAIACALPEEIGQILGGN